MKILRNVLIGFIFIFITGYLFNLILPYPFSIIANAIVGFCVGHIAVALAYK